MKKHFSKDTQTAKKHRQDARHYHPLEKSKPKPQGVTTSQPPGRRHKDRPTVAELGENVGKLGAHLLLGGGRKRRQLLCKVVYTAGQSHPCVGTQGK